MAAPVVGDDAIAVIEKEQHLRVPVVGRERPAVAEHDRLPVAPILVVDLRPSFVVIVLIVWLLARSLAETFGGATEFR